jgi:hypothetical protein
VVNLNRAEEEKAEEIPGHERRQGCFPGHPGGASPGEARREQEARPERKTQARVTKTAGGLRLIAHCMIGLPKKRTSKKPKKHYPFATFWFTT